MSFDGIATGVAGWLLRRVASLLGPPRREWLDALLAELDTVPRGPGRLVWVLGGLRLAVILAARSRSRAAWWRHPGRTLALLLGAPSRAVGHRPAGAGGTRAYLTTLACACVSGLSVLVLRGLLEDSPYAFNAGRAAPARLLNPDWGNPMSLAFDLVVLASAAELLAVLVLTVCFLRSARPAGGPLPGSVRAALVASALPLWVLLGATVLFGFAAHQSAPTVFDQGRAAGLYLTWASWAGLGAVMAVCAGITSINGLRPRRALRSGR